MRDLTEQNITEAVLKQLAGCDSPRLKQVLESMVRHFHSFIREVEPTPDEWMAGIQFLTDTGKLCDEKRQEFILLSDTLGVSILMDAINNRKPEGATPSSVLGPFYVEGAPPHDHGADLAEGDGERVLVMGTVRSVDGNPIADALLDVWQTAPNGLYHMQDADAPDYHLCGKLRTDAEGNYSFLTLEPVSYSIPDDGPVGKMLKACGRHPYRPAHIHFIVSAPGYKAVVTQLFTRGDRYLGNDAVFGVKDALIVDYETVEGGSAAAGKILNFDFVLEQSI